MAAAIAASFCVVAAVKREDFKTCAQSGFCRRHRAFRNAETRLPNIAIQSDTVKTDLAAGLFSASLELPPPLIKGGDAGAPTLYIEILELGAVRVRISPPTRDGMPHAHAALAALPLSSPARVALEMHGGRNPGDLTLTGEGVHGLSVNVSYNPLRISVIRNNEMVAILNHRDLMRYEMGGTKSATEDNAGTTQADPLRAIAVDGAFDESFGGGHDPKPKGPRSFGLDILFPGTNLAYGLAEHATSLNLPSTFGTNLKYKEPYRLYNLDVFEYIVDSPMALYGSVPLLQSYSASKGAVAALLLTASETWVDIARQEDGLLSHWMAETTPIDLFFFAADTPAMLQKSYLALTGMPHLPSVASLGYHQCRWNYNTRRDVEEVDDGFDKAQIPYDFIWLDIEHTSDKRYFSWDETKFPQPLEMVNNLAKKTRNLVTINDPHIKVDQNYFVYKEGLEKDVFVHSSDDKKPFLGHCWSGQSHWVDFISKAGREFWAKLYDHHKYSGSAKNVFAWNDMNEPSVFNSPEVTMPKDVLHDKGRYEHREVHNIFGMMQHRATFEGQLLREGVDASPDAVPRPFVLSRAFFVGTQRYGAIWTGDNSASWEHLRASTPMLLSLSVCGISFAGADVGGFFGNPDVELLVRWYEAASLQPFFRGHSHIETARREPWLFGEETTAHIRSIIRRRYRLMPAIYTAFAAASYHGETVMRPHFVEFPNDTKSHGIDDTFSLGSTGLFVAPVVEAGASRREVYFPACAESGYVDLAGDDKIDDLGAKTTKRKYEWHAAGTTSEVDAPLGQLPVFLRAGHVIAMRPYARRSSQPALFDPLALLVVASVTKSPSATGRLYLDDGHSMAHIGGARCWFDFTFDLATMRLSAKRDCAQLPKGVADVAFSRVTIVLPSNDQRLLRTTKVRTSTNTQSEISLAPNAPHAVDIKMGGVTTAIREWWVQLEQDPKFPPQIDEF